MCYTLIEQTADHSATRGTDGDTKARSVRVKIDIRDWAAGVAVHDGGPRTRPVINRQPRAIGRPTKFCDCSLRTHGIRSCAESTLRPRTMRTSVVPRLYGTIESNRASLMTLLRTERGMDSNTTNFSARRGIAQLARALHVPYPCSHH